MKRLTQKLVLILFLGLLSTAVITSCGKQAATEEQTATDSTAAEHPADSTEHPSDSTQGEHPEHPQDSTKN